MRVAIYALSSAADHGQESVVQILAALAAYAARRGWEVALERDDQNPCSEGRREGLRRLVAAVRTKVEQGVLVRFLNHLARSLRTWRETPSVAAIASHLHVSRSRVRSRLQELGLISQPAGASASASNLLNPATASEVPHGQA